jgi:3-hydroxyacyl-[acyl-carrier-protein] dehydratase
VSSPTSHAAPLRAVDEVVVDPDGTSAAGRKRVVRTDPYLSGHYPDFTIYPGVFQLESVVQTVRELVRVRHGGDRATLVRIRSLRFTAPLLAGDELTVAVTVTDDLVAKATCTRGDGQKAATMTLEFRRDRAR